MGNYASCTLATPLIKSGKAARVVFPGGEIRQFRERVRAAELMLDCPSYFVTNSRSLHIGRRFSPLTADEELEFGNVYIMFPMKRVNAVVAAGDMAMLFMAANSASKRISGAKARVQPENSSAGDGTGEGSEQEGKPRLSLDRQVEEGFAAAEINFRLSVCRSRKPSLATIKEEPINSR